MTASPRTTADVALQRLIAKEEIRERMLTYARAVDRRDWLLMRQTFHPDAAIHHAEYKGDVDGLVQVITGRQANVTITLHLFTNCLVEFAGPEDAVADTALAETYLLAHQWLDDAGARTRGLQAEPGGLEIESWGRYVDVFTLRDGAWRVQRRVTVFESQSLRPAIGRRTFGPEWPKPQADAGDPLWVARRVLGIG